MFTYDQAISSNNIPTRKIETQDYVLSTCRSSSRGYYWKLS